MALTTLANVKIFLGITTTTEDTKLTAIVSEVDRLIKNSIGMEIEAADFTEIHDLENNGRITVKNRPLNSVASVYLDYERNFPAETLLAATDYYLGKPRTGQIYLKGYQGTRILFVPDHRLTGIQGRFNQIVKVTYNGGFSNFSDLTLAANMLVAAIRLAGPFGGAMITSESLKIYSYSLGKLSLTQNDKSIFAGLGSIPGMLASYRGAGLRIM
jgi:hypothetical protein